MQGYAQNDTYNCQVTEFHFSIVFLFLEKVTFFRNKVTQRRVITERSRFYRARGSPV